jgi:radical SAM protein with 4Fe4S-binding SPASM domain
MLTNIIHRWDDIKKLKSGEMIYPSFADFHTSNVCNQYCVGCAYDGVLGTQMMTRETHFRIVDELLAIGVTAFDFAGGGEPSILPYLPELMRHIRIRSGYCAMITNGLVLTNRLQDALLECGTYVRFSLEASCETDYAKYKRVSSAHWKIVLNNIHTLQRKREDIGASLEISIKFAVGKSLRGYDHYMRCLDLGRKIGASRITIKALRHEPEELTLVDSHIEHQLLKNVIQAQGAEDLVSYWIKPFDMDDVSQCWLNPVHTVIDWDGSVYICCYFYYGRQDELKIGNINEKSFKEIWEDKMHWDKVKNINRHNCMKVDCKFFKHHQAVNEGLSRGHMEFI